MGKLEYTYTKTYLHTNDVIVHGCGAAPAIVIWVAGRVWTYLTVWEASLFRKWSCRLKIILVVVVVGTAAISKAFKEGCIESG